MRKRLVCLMALACAGALLASCKSQSDISRETSRIFNHYSNCWAQVLPKNPALGAHVIAVRVMFEKDGNLNSVAIDDSSKAQYEGDREFRHAADSLIDTIHACGRVQNLSMAKYEYWRDVILTFDPRIIIEVKAGGTILLYGKPVRRDELISRIDSKYKNPRTTEIVFMGDLKADPKTVIELRRELRAQGFTNMTLLAIPQPGRR